MRSFWSDDNISLLASLGSEATGLSQAAALQRLQTYGPNRTEAEHRLTVFRKIGQRLINPLVAILLVAATVSGFTGDAASFTIIVSAIAMSLALDILQEHRAELAAETLSKRRVSCYCLCDCPEPRSRAGFHNEHHAVAADNRSPGEKGVTCLGGVR